MLNLDAEQGVPFFESQGLSMLRILTDHGSDYGVKVENHYDELCLAINDIQYTKTKVKYSQTNGINESFHKTIL